MFQPRPKQAEVLNYQGGQMGVSAVPGSGKTATLSYLAAKLVATTDLASDQEILVVTLVNSAAGNFASSMAKYLRDEFQLLPGLGYRVRTLHALANEIVRERPALAGLSDTFGVLDERSTNDVLQDAVETWIRGNPDAPDSYLTPEHLNKSYTRNVHWADLVKQMANNFIRQAKDMQLSAADVADLSEAAGHSMPLVLMCGAIYEQYERSLRYRGAVDFQDLIRLALYILKIDEQYLARLQHQFPYILEDEAQDSSQLQDEILRLLTGKNGNRVRVGDPNQAIYESFTTADPKYLREFLTEPGVQARTLPNSGRSSASIIRLANHLIDWSLAHPNPAIREKQPLTRPYIEATPPGDPQGNPPDDPQKVHLRPEDYTGDEERHAVIQSLQHWLPDNQDKTCVVLLPFNNSGTKLVLELRRENIPYVENLRSTSATRAIVGSLQFVLDYLADPEDSGKLARVYRVWRRDEREDEDAARSIESVVRTLRKIPRLEEYLSPRLTDWLANNAGDNETLYTHLADFRRIVRRWQNAVDLPVDQLILTIGADLFQLDTEIATGYNVALYLRRFVELQPEARLPEYVTELREIAKGNRNFTGVGEDDDAFDPDQHKGKVTVTTMHKAKGLEWDRVYIMSANNYTYPSSDEFDDYIGEKWFIRDNLNLDAEARAQLDALKFGTDYIPGQATQEARVEYSAERLRLLYVGITRARRELIITWNTGRRGEAIEARPVVALRGWWMQQQENA